MKKEKYEIPVTEIIKFATEDVITTSDLDVGEGDVNAQYSDYSVINQTVLAIWSHNWLNNRSLQQRMDG